MRCEPAAAWGLGSGDLHGVAAADLNGDGRTDLYQTVGGGRGFGKVGDPFDRLYVGDAARHFIDVAPTRLPPDPHGRGRAARVLDYDRDGRLDVLVANARARRGDSRTRLYRQAPDGVFVDRAQDLDLALPGTAPLVHDLDGDGYPDVLLRRNIHWNDAGATFTATRLHADAPPVAHPVNLVADIDNDGRLDVLCFAGRDAHRGDRHVIDAAGVLWIDLDAPRKGEDEDRLTLSTRSPGLEILRLVHRGSTTEELAAGLDHRRVFFGPAKAHPRPYGYDLAGAGPVPLDDVGVGTPDTSDEGLYVFRPTADRWTVLAKGNRRAKRRGRFILALRAPAGFTAVEPDDLETAHPAAASDTAHVHLRNVGGRRFISQRLEIRGPGAPPQVASAAAGDFDNDGRVDLVLLGAAGTPGSADALLWNAGGGAFVAYPLPSAPRMGEDRVAHVWDMDGDGRLDLLLTSDVPGEAVVLRNVSSDANRWVEIVLEGRTRTARQAAGVRVELTGSAGTQVREVGEATRANASVLPLHFGIGADGGVGTVRVHWNSGLLTHAGDTLPSNRRHVLREPDSASP